MLASIRIAANRDFGGTSLVVGFGMPVRPRKPCRQAGCGALIAGGAHYCAKHAKARQMADTARRGTAHERGYTSAWTRARDAYLEKHRWCVHCCKRHGLTATTDAGVVLECAERGVPLPYANVVDHIKPHRLKEAIDSGDANRIAVAKALFWDSLNNWQSLCTSDHNIKTATEDGGFGRSRK